MNRLTARKFEQEVDTRLRELLEPLGFKETNPGLISRWKEKRYIAFRSRAFSRGGNNVSEITGHLGFWEPWKILNHFMTARKGGYGVMASTVKLTIPTAYDKKILHIKCLDESQLPQAREQLKDFVFDKAMRLFDTIQTPQQLMSLFIDKEHTLNKWTIPQWIDYRERLDMLIYARLYAPERYEELKLRYAGAFETLVPELKSMVASIIEFLDQKELPDLEQL